MGDPNPRPNNEASDKTKASLKSLATWMRVLAETCRLRESEEITPEKIKAYAYLLNDIDAAVMDAAMREIGQEAIWFPTVAEIRDKCKHVTRRMRDELESLNVNRRRDIERKILDQRMLTESGEEKSEEQLQAEFRDMLQRTNLRGFPPPQPSESELQERLRVLREQAERLGANPKVEL